MDEGSTGVKGEGGGALFTCGLHNENEESGPGKGLLRTDTLGRARALSCFSYRHVPQKQDLQSGMLEDATRIMHLKENIVAGVGPSMALVSLNIPRSVRELEDMAVYISGLLTIEISSMQEPKGKQQGTQRTSIALAIATQKREPLRRRQQLRGNGLITR